MSEPYIDHDKGSPTQNNCTCIYIIMYHLPRVCCTLVPEIRVCPEMLRVCPEMLRVCPEMLRVFQYIDVLMCTCVIYNCMHSTEQQG